MQVPQNYRHMQYMIINILQFIDTAQPFENGASYCLCYYKSHSNDTCNFLVPHATIIRR